jgi:hypothetical protein
MDYKIDTPDKYFNSRIFTEQNPDKTLFGLNGELYISGCANQAEADALIAAHNPPAPTEPTVAEKLASVGLSVDDLKAALGLS